MATDLEKLVVQLSADIKGYERELRKASATTDREAKRMESRFRSMNKSVESSMQSAARSLKAFGAGFVGAFSAQKLAEIVRAAAAAGDAIGDLADQTGATTDSIQILRYAAQQTGSSVEQMDKAMAKFAVNLGEAQRGSGQLAKLLEANGIALKDAAGNARSFNDVFNDVVDLVGRAPDQFSKLEVITTAFGAANDELVTTFANGRAGVDAYGRKLQELHGIISRDGIAALGELDAKYNDVMVSMDAATKRLVVATGPLLEFILGEISQFAEQLGEIADTIDLLLQGKFAEAGRLAVHGRESPAAQVERELTSNAEQRLAVEQELKKVQDQLIAGTAGRYAVQLQAQERELLNRKNLLEVERQRLEAQRQSIRLQSAQPSGTGPVGPFAPPPAATIIPPGAGGGTAGELRQLQASLAATRKLPLNDELREALEYAAKLNNLIIEVTSGGQVAKGTPGPRTGSTRHDLGRAADFRIRDPVTGQLLDSRNPADMVRINQLMESLSAAGLTGFGHGAGYMGTTMFHAGYGTTANWGGMPVSMQAAIGRGRENPAYVAGVEGARLAAAQDVANEATKAAEKQAEALEKQREALAGILTDREEELAFARLELDYSGQSAAALEEQRVYLEEINRLKAAGLPIDAAAIEAARTYAAELAGVHAAEVTATENREASIERLDAMRDFSRDVLGGVVSDLRAGASAGEIFANVLDKLIAKLADLSVDWLTSALFGPQGTSMPGILGTLFGGFRQHGGPVQPGRSYVVGEGGKPELFVPSTPGMIVPSVNAMGSRAPTVMGGELRGAFDISPSPLFMVAVRSTAAAMIAENNRTLPSYLGERQRRGI